MDLNEAKQVLKDNGYITEAMEGAQTGLEQVYAAIKKADANGQKFNTIALKNLVQKLLVSAMEGDMTMKDIEDVVDALWSRI
jgi:hypothetical protein